MPRQLAFGVASNENHVEDCVIEARKMPSGPIGAAAVFVTATELVLVMPAIVIGNATSATAIFPFVPVPLTGSVFAPLRSSEVTVSVSARRPGAAGSKLMVATAVIPIGIVAGKPPGIVAENAEPFGNDIAETISGASPVFCRVTGALDGPRIQRASGRDSDAEGLSTSTGAVPMPMAVKVPLGDPAAAFRSNVHISMPLAVGVYVTAICAKSSTFTPPVGTLVIEAEKLLQAGMPAWAVTLKNSSRPFVLPFTNRFTVVGVPPTRELIVGLVSGSSESVAHALLERIKTNAKTSQPSQRRDMVPRKRENRTTMPASPKATETTCTILE